MKSIKIKSELKPSHKQRIILTTSLREALLILEMPLLDLAQWIQAQIEQNPALQFEENSSSTFYIPPSLESCAASPPTLHQHLMSQAREVLSSPQDLQEIEAMIGNLDNKGLLTEPCSNPSLLSLLQSFDPPGIGATSLQHSLLLQLERKGEKNSMAYKLIANHFYDLVHNREQIPLPTEVLQSLLHTIKAHLSLDPTAPFRQHSSIPQTPDIFVEEAEESWIITLNDAFLPKFKVVTSPELGSFNTSALWIQKIVSRRAALLTALVKALLELQKDFFQGKTSGLHPLSLQQVAHKLKVHPSTISRAVKHKVLSCSQGIYPLRFFFPHATCDTISHHTAKEHLKALIQREDKNHPCTDHQLAKALTSQGIPCARRTIAKYRHRLNIPSALSRKKSSSNFKKL